MSNEKKWTLMFYFASDNALAPNIVSQLKAIKNAGFHPRVNVVAQFDPQTKETPTHIFDVNVVNKAIHRIKPEEESSSIGFRGDDPYVRSLVLDKLWGDEKDAQGESMLSKVEDSLKKRYEEIDLQNLARRLAKPVVESKGKTPDSATESGEEPSPVESLGAFLDLCATDNYKADHYMLFILGHGLVVGEDIFLFDENASARSLSLKNLADLLTIFKGRIGNDASFDLLGLHSCSMSSLEAACQLSGTAKYMLASQGPSFVGSWPYREMLIRIFKNVDKDVTKTIDTIFNYIMYNSNDFQLAGYSSDLCWSKLSDTKSISNLVSRLSLALQTGLKAESPLAQELILLAHWDAQSFWKESYTDLYDFCLCLKRRCNDYLPIGWDAASDVSEKNSAEKTNGESSEGSASGMEDIMKEIYRACDAMTTVLAEGGTLVVRSEFAGPECQYSHGLSVYFPWTTPVNRHFWETEYPAYQFNQVKGNEVQESWANFLNVYFDRTRRKSIGEERAKARKQAAVDRPMPGKESEADKPTLEQEILEEITFKAFSANGPLTPSTTLAAPEKAGGGSGLEKPGGGAGTGGDCDCPQIKNYPSFTRERPGRTEDRPPPLDLYSLAE